MASNSCRPVPRHGVTTPILVLCQEVLFWPGYRPAERRGWILYWHSGGAANPCRALDLVLRRVPHLAIPGRDLSLCVYSIHGRCPPLRDGWRLSTRAQNRAAGRWMERTPLARGAAGGLSVDTPTDHEQPDAYVPRSDAVLLQRHLTLLPADQRPVVYRPTAQILADPNAVEVVADRCAGPSAQTARARTPNYARLPKPIQSPPPADQRDPV